MEADGENIAEGSRHGGEEDKTENFKAIMPKLTSAVMAEESEELQEQNCVI